MVAWHKGCYKAAKMGVMAVSYRKIHRRRTNPSGSVGQVRPARAGIFRRWGTRVAMMWLAAHLPCALGAVLFSELMYHPSSEDPREEWIELVNTGPPSVSLAGWRLTAGVRFTFPPVVLPPGGRLVVAADEAVFRSLHPEVTDVVGDWDGILSNAGEQLELRDGTGHTVASVRYADDGDWGERYLAEPDAGHRSLKWRSPADGDGASIELVNPLLPPEEGQNWAPSLVAGGTPGAPNSRAADDIAPLILDVSHFPALPRSDESVAVTARIVDEALTGLTVELHHRRDGESTFTLTPMEDDGTHEDGAPGDGVYGVPLPPQPEGTIVEFYVRAVDAGGHERTWPAPIDIDGSRQQVANALYQVTDALPRTDLPVYRLILTERDRAELHQINRNSPTAPYSTGDQTRSHAQFNGTFISADGGGAIQVRYRVGIRNRGNGSRTRSPQSFRVNFPNDEGWNHVQALNLNSQQPHAQLFGSALYRMAGLPTQEARAVKVMVNGTDLAALDPAPFPFYVANEVLDTAFAERMWPLDNGGNIYRGIWLHGTGADLHYEGEDPEPYRLNYFKRTNTSEDDWSDLIELTRILDLEPDETYVSEVLRVADIEEWMLYFALEAIVDNRETNLANGSNGTGQGDDYFLYRGILDPRFRILPYDLDTILGEGTSSERIDDDLFRMTRVRVLDRLVKHPAFAPRYYAALRQALESVFLRERFEPLLRQTIGHLADEETLQDMLDFAMARAAWIRSQIPDRLSAVTDLAVRDGLPTTGEATTTLRGRADPVHTARVSVNGRDADWSIWETTWQIADLPLKPGINRLLIQAFDDAGREIDRTQLAIRREAFLGAAHSGVLAADTTWREVDSPHLVTGTVAVPAGVTLTVEPGATVYFASGATLEVQGRLVAEGTETGRIQFARQPGSGGWGPLSLRDSQADNRLVHVDFIGPAAGAHALGVHNARLWLEGCQFIDYDNTIVELDQATIDIRDCVFPSVTQNEIIHGSGMPAEGHVIIAGNFFGSTTGYSDVIDFTGGRRPGPILQVYDNIFSGGSDDALDLDGTDAHIEGNVFVHFHQDQPRPSTSNAIATDNGSAITVVRNLFFDNDHAVLLKNGAFLTSAHNTIVGCTLAAINFGEPEREVPYGRGASLRGDILWTNAALFENLHPPGTAIELTVRDSILQGDQPWPGSGNLALDPRLRQTTDVEWKTIRDAFSLLPGSPALGSGPWGLDRGALVPAGAAIGGGPVGITPAAEAAFQLGGPGITDVRWRLDDGAWSDPLPADTVLSVSDLPSGPHRLEVLGRNSAGAWQEASTAAVREWTVDPDHGGVRLHELLALSRTTVTPEGALSGYVELFNDALRPADLSGWRLAPSADPFAGTPLPAGTMLPPGGFLIVREETSPPATNELVLGFRLPAQGGALYLFDNTLPTPRLVDSIQYGFQIADLAVGRDACGQWVLNHPTPGAPNQTARTGDPSRLRLNEWLPASRIVFADDYLELFNGDDLPVGLDGLWLTDNPVGWPDRYVFPPLSFIPARGHLRLIADGAPEAGPRHLPFRLAAEQGMLGLLDPAGRIIDHIVYESPWPDRALGRQPDGAALVTPLPVPSPGAPNPIPAGGLTNILEETRVLIPMTNRWRYFQSGAAPANWTAPAFDDSAWPEGPALLARETSALPAPIGTTLRIGQITYYFRTTFNLESAPQEAVLELRTVVDDGCVLWLNGREWFRLGMPPGAITDDTRADRTVGNAELEGPFRPPAELLQPGENVLAAEVHQHSSNSSDIVFGLSLEWVHRTTNIVGGRLNIRLNELLAVNHSHPHDDGAPVDWVELVNLADDPAELTGLSLSDDPDQPRRWVFPEGATLPPHGFLTVACNPELPASASNTGFGLNRQGGALYLFDRPEKGGGLLDGLLYGLQAPDLALGRSPDGEGAWGPARPTPGEPNQAAPTGDPHWLRINEWLARPDQGPDWIELYNPDLLPVPLAGFRISDDLNDREGHIFPPLSFLGAGPDAFLVLQADGKPEAGLDHLPFKLAGSGEAIGLFDSRGWRVDAVLFDTQDRGVSEGRLPDGAEGPFHRFVQPTPGSPNAESTDPDLDGDRMPNLWETAYGLDPRDPTDAALDPDGDGLSNLQEFLAGTDPTDPASTLRIEALRLHDGPDQATVLRFKAAAGRTYSVLSRDQLETGDWRKVADVPAQGCDCPVEVIDPVPLTRPARFYRLVTPALP